jgi:ribokinase
LGTLDAYPEEDAKVELLDLNTFCGGPASTAMVTLSRLGVSTTFLGSISNDIYSNRIFENLTREKVDTSALKISPGYTSQFAFIGITKDNGKRTIFWHRGTVPHLKPADINLSPFPNAKILHVDSLMIDASIEAAKQAKILGMQVVMDAGTAREGTSELIQHVDVLIASETFAAPLLGAETSPENALVILRRLGPDQVVITLGAKGSIGLNEKGSVTQKACKVNAVDTTGAGDVYHGAYIYGLLKGWDLSRCMRFASATAALNCTKIGAQTGIPNLEAVQSLLGLEDKASYK